MKPRYVTILVIALILVMLVWRAASQQAPTPPATPQERIDLQPTPSQADKLEIARLNLVIAQQNFRVAIDNFRATCDQLKQVNKWPPDAVCDANTAPVSIYHFRTPAPTKPAEEKKP